MPTKKATKKAVKPVYAVAPEVVKIVKKVQKHILEEPKRFYMGDWVNSYDNRYSDNYPACGTTACIAGWVAILSKPLRKNAQGHLIGLPLASECERIALEKLQIPRWGGQGACGDTMFFSGDWPEPFKTQFEEVGYFSSTPENLQKRAEIAAARLEHFLVTGE